MNEAEQKRRTELRVAYITVAEEEHRTDPELIAIAEKINKARAEYVAYLETHIPLEYRTK